MNEKNNSQILNHDNTIDEKKLDIFLRQCLNIGECMYCAGAEINRIEDTLRRLGKAYGAEHTSAFVITSSIVITFEFPGHPAYTQSRRMHFLGSTDFQKLEALNELSRECSTAPIPIEELRERVNSILKEKPSEAGHIAGSFFAAFGFAIFFGGNLLDGMLAGLFGVVIHYLGKYYEPLCSNEFLYNFTTSFSLGLAISLLSNLIPDIHIEMIMIGDIMLLIPGVMVTNSIRNMLIGDMISGLVKLTEGLLLACATAGGFVLAGIIF